MFSVWTHPKTQNVRLYVAPKLIKPALDVIGEDWEPKTVKAWIEKLGEHWIMKVAVKTDKPVPAESLDTLKSILLGDAGLSGNETWEALVEQAELNTIQKQKPKAETDGQRRSKPAISSAPVTPDSRAKEAAKLDISRIKMPGDITIEVDHRETHLICDLLSKHPNITVKRATLELADFRVEDREGNELLIERKRCLPTESSPNAHNDFESSIVVDGRLFDQSERLKFKASNSDHHVIPVVLLEGDVHANSKRMLIQQVDGALSFLAAVQRISVLSSYGANHSAWVVAKLASHFIHGLFTPVSMHRVKPKALWDQKRYVLESLPGISSGIAEALLTRFGSVRAVAVAEEHELASVKGIGPKRSREVIRVLGEL